MNENPKFENEKLDNLISSLNIKKNQSQCLVDEYEGIDNYTEHQIVDCNENKSLCWNCTNNIEENISYQLII